MSILTAIQSLLVSQSHLCHPASCGMQMRRARSATLSLGLGMRIQKKRHAVTSIEKMSQRRFPRQMTRQKKRISTASASKCDRTRQEEGPKSQGFVYTEAVWEWFGTTAFRSSFGLQKKSYQKQPEASSSQTCDFSWTPSPTVWSLGPLKETLC